MGTRWVGTLRDLTMTLSPLIKTVSQPDNIREWGIGSVCEGGMEKLSATVDPRLLRHKSPRLLLPWTL